MDACTPSTVLQETNVFLCTIHNTIRRVIPVALGGDIPTFSVIGIIPSLYGTFIVGIS